MAARLLQTLADDNPDLQKQVGCMTGIFQIFDCHQMVAGRRYGHRKLLPANPQFSNGGLDGEYNVPYPQQAPDEPNYYVCPNEKQRFSTESSRDSFSSSCSSSLSSLECSRSAQPEPSSIERSGFLETPSMDPIPKQSSSSPTLGRKSIDFRDVVKDSMYREARGLPVKPKDSMKANEISYRYGLMDTDNVPASIKESLKVLAKLRESPWCFNDVRQLPRSASTREGSFQSLSKDASRFSYDGREQMQNRLSFESRETIKSTFKLKELPRLSLDSREGSMQTSHSALKSNLVQKSTEKVGGISNEKRPPSVVAKLMGLEALPDPSCANDNARLGLKNPNSAENFDPFLRASKRNELNSRIRVSNSLSSSLKEPESPRWRNPDGTMRQVLRVPNEPAPWRQIDGNRNLQKPGEKPIKAVQKPSDSVPSVYGEIEKRLKDLEFKQSGKDLRALKQILEAIQAKGLLETRKEGQATNFGSNKNSLPKSRHISRMERQQLTRRNHPVASTSMGSDDAMLFESPIVIMKPAKLAEKDGFVDSSMIPIQDLSNLPRFPDGVSMDSRKSLTDRRMARDQSHKPTRKNSIASSDKKINAKNKKSNQIPLRHQLISKDNSTLSKNSSSVSPRLQQKKLELERRARPPTPPSVAKKSKQTSNRQTSEVASPGGRHRLKYSNLSPSEDQMSEVSNDSRTLSYQGDDVSVHSDGSTFLGLNFDIEVVSQSPSAGSTKCSDSGLMPMEVPAPLMDEDEVFAEFPTVPAEHHSPVSVLDSLVHIEDDPTPVKKMQNSLRESSADVTSHDHHEDKLDVKMDTMSTCSSPEIDRKKLQNIEQLVQKLKRVNSTHNEESTDYIASLCENTNPDHRYISEILLASGLLLRDLGSGLATFQLHPSGCPINPKLFFVLEQTKSSGTVKEIQPKIHRKLIFDVVNEILAEKLMALGVLDEPWLMRSEKVVKKTLTAQKLLKEMCAEVELLDAKKPSSFNLHDEDDGLKGILREDVVRHSGSWTEFGNEKSLLVLDIERLIFKDLVNEVLVGGGAGLRTKPSRHRELFGS